MIKIFQRHGKAERDERLQRGKGKEFYWEEVAAVAGFGGQFICFQGRGDVLARDGDQDGGQGLEMVAEMLGDGNRGLHVIMIWL